MFYIHYNNSIYKNEIEQQKLRKQTYTHVGSQVQNSLDELWIETLP